MAECPMCGLVFGSYDDMLRHLFESHRDHDLDAGVWVCWCNDPFITSDHFRGYVLAHFDYNGGVTRHYHDCMMGVAHVVE